jgi:hypothetical protein
MMVARRFENLRSGHRIYYNIWKSAPRGETSDSATEIFSVISELPPLRITPSYIHGRIFAFHFFVLDSVFSYIL